MANTLDGDLYVRGRLKADAIVLTDASVGDAQMDPDNPPAAEKLQHQHQKQYAQKKGTSTVADAGTVVHVAAGTGAVEAVTCGVAVAVTGDYVVTVGVKKNGVSILSSTLSLDSGNVAYTGQEFGTLATTAYNAGDVFEVSVSVAGTTGAPGQGVFAQVTFRERAE